VTPLAGEWVEEVEEVTNRRFEAEDGVGSVEERPAGGAQAGWPPCAPVRQCCGLGGGRGGAGELWSCVGLLGRRWTAAKSTRGGGARDRQDAGVPRPGMTGRCGAFIGGCGSGSMASGALRCGRLPRSVCADLGRSAWQGERTTDRWSKAWRERAARSTTRSRRSRHREASRDLRKARAALGTHAGGTGRRGAALKDR
jgi:hypothetical protein